VKEANVPCFFVDYGDMGKEVDYRDCYEMSQDFIGVPIMGVPIFLEGVQGMEMPERKRVMKRLEKLTYEPCTLKLLDKLEIVGNATFMGVLTSVKNKMDINELVTAFANEKTKRPAQI